MKQFSKKTNSILALIFLIAGATFTSCNSPAEKVDNAKENVKDAEENLAEAKNEYNTEVANFRRETSERIMNNEITINDHREKIKNAKQSVRATYEEQVAILERKNSEMKRRMDEYSDNGLERWQTFKTEFNHDMDELGIALKDFTIDNK